MLLTLKRCLPSFKFASGAQLGDELLVVDVDNSTGSGIGIFKILEGNRISRIPKALEEKRRFMADRMDCISSSEVLMDQVTEQQESYLVKRKLGNLCESQSELGQEDESANQEYYTSSSSRSIRPNLCNDRVSWLRLKSSQIDNKEHSASCKSVKSPSNTELVIKVQYGDQLTLHYSLHTSKLSDIKKIIEQKYNLDTGSYNLQFLDSLGNWLRLVDDNDWDSCLKNRRITYRQTIRLRVLSFTNSMV